MGLAVRNKSTGWISGWCRYGSLPHDPEAEELVECEAPDDLKPPEQVSAESAPRSVTNAQARLALIKFGILPDKVDAEIAKIADPIKRATVSTLWNYRETFSIDNPDLREMAGILGLTDHLPEILRLAETL